MFGLALEQRKALVLLHERGQKAVRLSAGLMTRLDAYVSAARARNTEATPFPECPWTASKSKVLVVRALRGKTSS